MIQHNVYNNWPQYQYGANECILQCLIRIGIIIPFLSNNIDMTTNLLLHCSTSTSSFYSVNNFQWADGTNGPSTDVDCFWLHKMFPGFLRNRNTYRTGTIYWKGRCKERGINKKGGILPSGESSILLSQGALLSGIPLFGLYLYPANE